jgi:nitroreductase
MPTTQTLPLSVSDAIVARRSIRKYKPGPLPAVDLERILHLASLAPSSANFQPWRLVVVQDPDLQARLQAAAYNQAQVGSAPALIVLYGDMEDALATLDEVLHPQLPEERRAGMKQQMAGMFAGKSQQEKQAFAASQGGIMLGFLLLAAQSLGYATSTMLGFDQEQFKTLLNLPEHVTISAIVALGVADESGFSAHRHPLSRIVRYVGASS